MYLIFVAQESEYCFTPDLVKTVTWVQLDQFLDQVIFSLQVAIEVD